MEKLFEINQFDWNNIIKQENIKRFILVLLFHGSDFGSQHTVNCFLPFHKWVDNEASNRRKILAVFHPNLHLSAFHRRCSTCACNKTTISNINDKHKGRELIKRQASLRDVCGRNLRATLICALLSMRHEGAGAEAGADTWRVTLSKRLITATIFT